MLWTISAAAFAAAFVPTLFGIKHWRRRKRYPLRVPGFRSRMNSGPVNKSRAGVAIDVFVAHYSQRFAVPTRTVQKAIDAVDIDWVQSDDRLLPRSDELTYVVNGGEFFPGKLRVGFTPNDHQRRHIPSALAHLLARAVLHKTHGTKIPKDGRSPWTVLHDTLVSDVNKVWNG